MIKSCETYISWSHDSADLLHRVEVRAQASVHGEDLLVDDGGNGKAVEAVGERLPELDVITTLALVVETVDTVDGSALVVTPQDKEVLRVLDLVCQEQADGLERLLSSVDVVTKEEVVGLGRETTVLKKAQQVIILAVDIAADLVAVPMSAGWKRRGRGASWLGRQRRLTGDYLTLMGASSSSRIG